MLQRQTSALFTISSSSSNLHLESQSSASLDHATFHSHDMLLLKVVLSCACWVVAIVNAVEKPPFWEKPETARWLVHNNIWGTLSTTSVHLNGQAWGQPKSFVDGSVNNSTGILYFYDSEMDTSLQDVLANNNVSFSLSAAQLGYCPVQILDPENPLCARLVMSGRFVMVTDQAEVSFAQSALFERHPTMTTWPVDHSWHVYKIEPIVEIWLIDVFGGASIVPVKDYFAADVDKQ